MFVFPMLFRLILLRSRHRDVWLLCAPDAFTTFLAQLRHRQHRLFSYPDASPTFLRDPGIGSTVSFLIPMLFQLSYAIPASAAPSRFLSRYFSNSFCGISRVPYHFEPLKLQLRSGRDVGFASCDVDLLFYCIYAFQVRQEKSAPAAGADDHAVPLHIQLLR